MSKTSKVLWFAFFLEIAVCKLLLYPTTRPHYKLIAGFGVPVEELDYETLLIGNVFKTSFRLPASVKQVRTHGTVNIKGRRSIDGYPDFNSTTLNNDVWDSTPTNSTYIEDFANESDDSVNETSSTGHHQTGSAFRWAMYRGLEAFADRLGLVGRACVLKSICETADLSFHYHNGLYGELLHVIFTPSSSADKLSSHSDNEYFHAEELGKSGAPCERIFKDCKKSMVEQFTDIYDVTQAIFERFTK